MISTLAIKQQQLANGFYTTGSGSEIMLIMGSCRVAPIVWYMQQWNEANGNRYTIHSIDPFSWNWDLNENRTDYEKIISELETHEGLLAMLKSVDVFIHEHYQNAGMFNVKKDAEKNIYQFALSPKIDVCIPSWNNLFILSGDIVSFDLEIRKKSVADYNMHGKLSEQTKKEILEISQDNVRKFGNVCYMSDLPEMVTYFLQNWIDKRFWWTFNHTSKNFTLAIFKLLNDKFLHLDLSKGFDENHVDMFANNYTKLTELDMEFYNFKWPGEEVIELKSKLF